MKGFMKECALANMVGMRDTSGAKLDTARTTCGGVTPTPEAGPDPGTNAAEPQADQGLPM